MSLSDDEERILQASLCELIELQNELVPVNCARYGRQIDALSDRVEAGDVDEAVAAAAFVWVDEIKQHAADAATAARSVAEAIEATFSEPDLAAGFERRAGQLRSVAALVENVGRIARLRALTLEAGFIVQEEAS